MNLNKIDNTITNNATADDAKNAQETKEVTRVSKKAYPFGVLYEYDNGLRVIKTNKVRNQTTLRYTFLGGSSSQKCDGLAHFTEHSLFFSKIFDKEYDECNGVTNGERTEYYFKMPHDDLRDIKTLNALLTEKGKIKSLISNNIDLFFNEVNRADFDFSYFEEEKSNIINAEFGRYPRNIDNDTEMMQFINSCRRKYYTSRVANCGNRQTLKNVIIDDVLEFKKNNYVVENLWLTVDSPLDYEKDLEKLIVVKIDKQAQSNPETKVDINYLTFKPIDFERYNISMDNAEVDGYVKSTMMFSLPIINENNSNQSLATSYLLTKLRYNKENEIIEKIRYQDRLVYAIGMWKQFDDGDNNIVINATVDKDNLKKLLMREVVHFKNLINLFSPEQFYLIKLSKETWGESFVDWNKRECKDYENFYDAQKFTNEALNEAEKYFDSLTFEDAKKLLEEALKNVKLNVVLKGDFTLKDLPSFDLLRDILHDEQKDMKEYAKNMEEEDYFKRSNQIFKMKEKLENARALTIYEGNEKA